MVANDAIQRQVSPEMERFGSAAAVQLDLALIPGVIAQGSGVVIHMTSIQRVLPLH